jgi:hypothetical protein
VRHLDRIATHREQTVMRESWRSSAAARFILVEIELFSSATRRLLIASSSPR